MSSNSAASPGALPQRSLRIENLRKEYVRGKPILKDISFEVKGHSSVAIIGPSGTGKSTLIRCVNKLIPPTSGTVFVSGENIPNSRGKNYEKPVGR